MSFVKGEVIVIFKHGTDVESVVSGLGLKIKDQNPHFPLVLIEVPAGSEEQWADQLSQRDDVQTAETNRLMQLL